MNKSEKATKIIETGTIGRESEIPKAVSQAEKVNKSLYYFQIPTICGSNYLRFIQKKYITFQNKNKNYDI